MGSGLQGGRECWGMITDLRDELKCSICLNFYTDPVMLSCGHNFCRVCIDKALDSQKEHGNYTCPDCRAKYCERPALQRNIKLCNVVELFISTQLKHEHSVSFCDFCDVLTPSVKICLNCDASLCEAHLTVHNKLAEHLLIKATESQQNRKCSVHGKILEYYCFNDAVCVCMFCCLAEEHGGHQVELLCKAAEKKKDKWRVDQDKLTSEKVQMDQRVQRLENHMQDVQSKAAFLGKQVSAIISDIKEQLEDLEKRVLDEISKQKDEVFSQVSDMVQQLKMKSMVLTDEICHFEHLCNIDGLLNVLQVKDQESANHFGSKMVENNSNWMSDETSQEVKGLDETLISIAFERSLHNLVNLLPVLKAKRGFSIQKESDILLDVNSSPTDVIVSDDLKILTGCSRHWQSQDTSDQYVICQALSNRSFSSGQHYWEVETSKSGNWRIGVSYSTGKMRGVHDLIGSDNKSWCLWKWDSFSSVKHNQKQSYVYLDPFVHRYGIYLDYEAGRLSFYQLCDPIQHLHTFTATFTKPLHAAFFVYMNGWVRLWN
ncbi:E3 ubiquitin ISG15 ligase TRIM25-like [Pelobates cultripes]|uniref:E3 ubiquitin ISG15 ligase TRIM25-like n=1 Tax=Pelobates cultripes TaxID=61616 RepID=A0AAD1WV62_PELCU|nr:E3 ubiquitin ISG15 ligase TRIM25-like [Pelobates cultripes]